TKPPWACPMSTAGFNDWPQSYSMSTCSTSTCAHADVSATATGTVTDAHTKQTNTHTHTHTHTSLLAHLAAKDVDLDLRHRRTVRVVRERLARGGLVKVAMRRQIDPRVARDRAHRVPVGLLVARQQRLDRRQPLFQRSTRADHRIGAHPRR